MNAFLNGFFSVFLPPIIPPGDIPSLDLDGDGFIVKPAGELLAPPTLASTWQKVGKHLKTAMSDYEHHAKQQ